MPEPVCAVLFDFGGVVVDGPFDAFTAYESAAGAPPGFLRAVNSRNPDTNAWAALERGQIDEDVFVERFEAEAQALGHAIDGRGVLAMLTRVGADAMAARPVVLAAVDRCRAAGLRLGLLTNNVAPMASRPGTAWVHDHFDVVLESCLLGVRKP
ncbi:MAG: putative hydrolase of the superfamily, partial [Pseudonocardiales bacterium]|nr:putative hydrolase of the superfamily [Pseudonocardiales bacterium]